MGTLAGEFECGHSGWQATQLRWYIVLPNFAFEDVCTHFDMFNDVPCSLPYSTVTNLRHESLTSFSDVDRSPIQRLSANVISLFNTILLLTCKHNLILSVVLSNTLTL